MGSIQLFSCYYCYGKECYYIQTTNKEQMVSDITSGVSDAVSEMCSCSL